MPCLPMLFMFFVFLPVLPETSLSRCPKPSPMHGMDHIDEFIFSCLPVDFVLFVFLYINYALFACAFCAFATTQRCPTAGGPDYKQSVFEFLHLGGRK